ncbi:hypothetical protein ES332_D06G185400v1 [Gossypium tomentosum]|uniref:Uncharacterized protein n=1 Tax=Gossypium tomentosum TaxID=34277 RepID=A0A5D2KMR6_GOSTO|nr:hypothetical protein ES332_D06G185400v1 [Gossypium tomentosum]
MGMETKDEFTTREPEQAQVGSRGPRLVINEMVMRNFKSYASEQRVGPFHKEVEKDVKARTTGEMGAAKSLCTPFEQPELPEVKYWLFTIYRTPNFFLCAWLILLYACLILHPSKARVRHRLRKDHGIEGGIPVVFSLEKPKAQLLPFRGPSGEEDNPSDYQWGNSSNILKQNLK